MKQKLLLLLLLLAAWGARAQAPAWQSALSSAAVDVRDVATNTNGDVFVTGSFTGSVTFGPNTLTSTGGQDMFVAKWAAGASTWAWGASGGGGTTGAYDGSPTDNNDLGNAIVVNGNRVYVTGQYHATTFASGSGTLTNTGGWDMFLAKFTDNTTSVAASGLLGSTAGAAQEYAYGVAVNPTTGNVYVTGYFGNSTYLGATIGGAALTSGGSADAYVAKYFDNGTTLSNAGAIGVGGASGEVATCLALNGNTIYVGGRFGSNASPFGTTAGANDMFVARFTDSNPNATGNLTYNNALRGGGDQTDGAQGIAVNGSSVYVTGYMSSSTAAIAGSTLTNQGGYDIFVARYTDNGSALVNGYAVRDGGTGDEDSVDGSIGADIAVNGSSVYVTSNYNTAATIAGTTLTSAGGNDVFVARYTDTGATFTGGGAVSGGGTGDDRGYALAVNGTQGVVGGLLGGAATFGGTAVNGNSFAALVSFGAPPTVTTAAAGSITSTSAVLGGNVTADGGAAVTNRGMVYSSTNQTPAIGGTGVTQDANGTGTGSFSKTISGLTPGTTYYVRAYAINSVGTSYGSVVSFTILNLPTVTTDAATSIATTTAVLGGSVTADGGTAVTDRGVVYSSTNTTPTTADTKAANGSGTGTFSATVSGLASRTTYNVRAYAINSVGISYGSVVSFTTLNNAPVVTTTGGNTTFIIGGGAVAIDNGLTVTDADNATLASATISITAGLQSGQDVLSFTNTNTTLYGNIGSAASANGTLPLSSTGATATVAQWQAALRAVTFINSSGTAPTTTRTVAFVVNDGTANSAPATKNVVFAAPTTVVSVTRLLPSPTATAQVSYRVVFSRSVTGLTVSNFTTTNGGTTVTSSSVSSASGSGTTYTVTVNTGTGNGTLRLDVNNSTGITPTVSGLPYAGEVYTITKSFAAAPQLTIVGTGGTGSDVTAFVDVAQVLSGGSPFASGLQNGSFETHAALANGDFGYNPAGATWTFNSQSGIAESGSAFTPTTPIPNGIAVAFVQSNGGGNGQLQQNLAVPTGTSYQVSFQAAQRVCCTTLDQALNVFLNGVYLGTIQPNSNAYTTFTSPTFAVTAPALTATVSTTSSSPTINSPIPFAVSFSQSVGTTFAATDLTITGGTLNVVSFSGSGAGPYTFTVTPSGTGTVSVSLAAGVANDANNTQNTASNLVSVQYDQPVTAAPVVTTPGNGSLVNTATPTYGGTAPANSTVTVYVDGTSIGTATATGGNWTFTQSSALAQGSHTVYATAQTSGSAVSANSTTNTFTVDSVQPTVAISSSAGASGGTTGTSPIPFTVTFSEGVTGFVAGDVTVTNGSITGFTPVSGTNYTFNVTPNTAGTATTVNVPANVAQDAASNGNTGAPSAYSITYVQLVTAAPVVNTPANGYINTTLPTYTGTAPAGSAVTVYVDGTSIGTTTATGVSFSLTQPSPLTQGGHTVYATAQTSGSAVSANSNTNTFVVDTVPPTVAITSSTAATGGSSSSATFAYTVTFSETVTGFVQGDVTVTGGSISGFTPVSGTTYTFSVMPSANGVVNVSVPTNVAQDAAGNFNTAATPNPYAITYVAPITATVWTGNVSTDWFTAGNWTAGVPTATVDATIPGAPSGGRFPLLGAGTASVRNLTLNSGSSLNMNGGTLNVNANLTNNGSFVATGGTLALGSTTTTNILGSSNTRFWNLTVGGSGAQSSTSASTSVQRLLTLNGNFTTNSNPVTLESNATNTGMIVNNGSNAIVGNVTVQRYISPDLNPNAGYRHVAAPVSGATVASLTTGSFSPTLNATYNTSATPNQERPFPTVYGYDQSRLATTTNNLSTFEKGWFSPTSTGDALTVGQGYTVNLAANQTWNFTGAANNGDKPLSLTRNSGAFASASGLALVGNPYPSPLDWSLVGAADRPNVDGVIYVFASNDLTNAYTGTYGFYQNGIGTISPVLPLGQGFFVRVSLGQATGTLTFRNSQRVTSYQNPTYLRTAETRPVVHMTLKGVSSPTADDAFVYFETGATDGYEAQYDGEKLPNPNGLNLSSSFSASQRLCVNGLEPLGTSQKVVPLAVGVPAAGAYSLTSAQLLNLDATPVYLRDLQLGTLTDLRLQPSYQFTVSNASALITGRFELVFSPQKALATVPAALAQQVALYPNPAKKAAFVELPASLGRQAVTATLVDALGREMRTVTLPAQGALAHQLDLTELATGVYALRLSTSAGVVVKKLVVE